MLPYSISLLRLQSGAASSAAGGKTPAALSQSTWLSFGMDAALGCRANVFQVQHGSTSKKTGLASNQAGSASVTIHPQAVQLVCQHVIDTLIFLSKAYTSQFLPHRSPTITAAAGTADSPTASQVTTRNTRPL